MKNKINVLLASALMVLSACDVDGRPDYTVTATTGADADNTMAYILDWDTSENIDSALVTDGKVVFKGDIDEPVIARLMINGARGPLFVLEKGEIAIDTAGIATGTVLNDSLNIQHRRINDIVEESNRLNPENDSDKVRSERLARLYETYPKRMYNENRNNVLGMYWFIQSAYDMNLGELDRALETNPRMKRSVRLSNLHESLTKKEATSVGKHYKNFEVTYDGKAQRLSSYISPDHYTLVDFWASWCGPCMRLTPVIKGLYDKYKDHGLEVVGVAVWDRPEDTLKAIENHGITWPCIINAQTIPTDLYGISGIPTVILIAPDGTIVSRDKQGDELVADVEKYLSQPFAEPTGVEDEVLH